MNKIKKITLALCCPLISFPLSLLSSCNSVKPDDKTEYKLDGGSAVILGSENGFDQNCWHLLLNKRNLSRSAKWLVEASTPNIFFVYNNLEEGVQIAWKNLHVGTYQIILHSTIFINNDPIKLTSEKIILNVLSSSPIKGGSTNILSTKTNEDSKAWHIYYNDKDYSKDAKWSIAFVSEIDDKIGIKYQQEKNGAIVNWHDLEVNKSYEFMVQAEINVDSQKTLTFFSEVIKLNIYDDTNKIEIIGGSYSLFISNVIAGNDTNPIFVYLNDKTDVTEKVSFEIISDNHDVRNCIKVYKKDTNFFIHWNQGIPQGFYHFKIKATLDEIQCEEETTRRLFVSEK